MIRSLTDSQLEKIRETSRAIIEERGFHVQHEHILKRARAAGAQIDESSGTVRIPGDLLSEPLELIPSQYTISALQGA